MHAFRSLPSSYGLALLVALFVALFLGAGCSAPKKPEPPTAGPDPAEQHFLLAQQHAEAGRHEEAIVEYREAIKVAPDLTEAYYNIGNEFRRIGDYKRAIQAYNKTIALDPSSPLPHGAMARTYEETGRYQESLDILAKHLPTGDAIYPQNSPIPQLRAAYAKDGAAGYWRKMLEFESASNAGNLRDKIRVALIYCKLGNKDKAIEMLNKAYAMRAGDMIFVNVEPGFDSIRQDPRYQALMKKIGAPNPT